MPSTYSTRLRIENIANGEQDATWGDTVDTSLGTVIEEAIAGVASVTHSDAADYTLSTANGLTDEARQMVLDIGGTLTANRNVVCPSVEKLYVVSNNTSGGFDITVKTSGGSGISVPNGKSMLLYCDGTDVLAAITNLPASSTIGDTEIVTLTASQALTNKTINIASNTLTGVAPLASPTFTGTVTIPTPFTLGAVSVLPTGTELNFVDGVTSNIQTQLNLKAALASPDLTGNPTAPTPSVGDNDTSIATTAFVSAEIAAEYTAADVLAKLLTVDGDGSGLDADTIGGSAYPNANVMRAGQTVATGRLHDLYSDWDDAIAIGMYLVSNWGTNIPTNGPTGSGGYGVLTVERSKPSGAGADFIVQRYVSVTDTDAFNATFFRTSGDAGATWLEWQRVFSSRYMGTGSGWDADLLDGAELTDIDPRGQHTIWMPAGAMTPTTTSGAQFGSLEATTNKQMIETLDFNTATDEYAQFSIQMPKGWDLGTLIAQFVWSNLSGTGTVAWTLQAVALADGDAIDTAFSSSGGAVVDTVLTAGDIHISSEASALTALGSPAAEELIYFQVYRDVSADTLGVDARLHGIKIHYTTDASTDT